MTFSTSRLDGFRGEYLWELEIASRQILALAEAIPEGNYGWRPDVTARSVSEVLTHIGAGTLMMLDLLNRLPVPADLYADMPTERSERVWALVRRNDELEATVRDKGAVIVVVQRGLDALGRAVTETDDEALDSRLQFLDEPATLRRAYLRLLVHTHEHMGQLIAYARALGISMPWADWRPDRRAQM